MLHFPQQSSRLISQANVNIYRKMKITKFDVSQNAKNNLIMTENNKQDKTKKRLRLIICLLSMIIFIISLSQDALICDDYDGQKIHSSLSLLFMGGLAILGGGPLEWLIWLANPIYIIALTMFINNKKAALKFSIAASLIGLSFLKWNKILAASSGRTATITSLELGYWLWISSMLFLTLGIIYYLMKEIKA